MSILWIAFWIWTIVCPLFLLAFVIDREHGKEKLSILSWIMIGPIGGLGIGLAFMSAGINHYTEEWRWGLPDFMRPLFFRPYKNILNNKVGRELNKSVSLEEK